MHTSIVSVPNLYDERYDVPFVPTSMETAKRMLEIADVGPTDIVYDLGCGDARILILAVESFKAKKAVGYEIRREMFKNAVKKIQAKNLSEKVTMINGDLFNADLCDATVITLYLTHWANKKLKPKLEKEVKPGTRIVSHDFEISGWQPIRNEWRHGDTIYLYVVPHSSQAKDL